MMSEKDMKAELEESLKWLESVTKSKYLPVEPAITSPKSENICNKNTMTSVAAFSNQVKSRSEPSLTDKRSSDYCFTEDSSHEDLEATINLVTYMAKNFDCEPKNPGEHKSSSAWFNYIDSKQ